MPLVDEGMRMDEDEDKSCACVLRLAYLPFNHLLTIYYRLTSPAAYQRRVCRLAYLAR